MKGYVIKTSDWETIYPIGSIYTSVNSTSPASLFGGTWEQIQDKFLLCSGSTYSGGSTGGSTTHTHNTAAHTLTINEIPSHEHTLTSYSISSGSYEVGSSAKLVYKDYQTTSWISENSAAWMNKTGGSQGHNHGYTDATSTLPPYLAVYVWKRTA